MRKFRTMYIEKICVLEEWRTEYKSTEFFDWFPARFTMNYFADETAALTFLKKELRTSFILNNKTCTL